MGFFGLYSTTLKILPGLPAIELAQFYILISLIKVLRKSRRPSLFYRRWFSVMLGYIIFLILFGLANGLRSELNVHFKLIKMTMPLLLFYSIPRLFTNLQNYKNLFSYLFLITILAFIAQLITLFTGFVPQWHFNPITEAGLELEVEVGRNFRVLNNPGITLLSLFGALYFLSIKHCKDFKQVYLYIIIVSCFALAFLSATRGWIISVSFIILLSMIFVLKVQFRHVITIVALFIVALVVGLSVRKIHTQIQFSIDRLFTLNSLAKGDITADGTLARLDERSPVVVKVWKKSPVFGQGFSDQYFEYSDMHVGNQNILMHAGIIGFALIFSFLLYFIIKMLMLYSYVSPTNPFSSTFLLFPVFLIGWIFLHSTSGQQFAFYGLPNDIFPQAIFLGLAGLTYSGYEEVNLS